MRFSRFGQLFSTDAGIVRLMDDLGGALAENPDMVMLGGGNPGRVPRMQALFRERMRRMVDDGDAFDRLVGQYGPPQGDDGFIVDLAQLLRREYGWAVGPANIAVTNGSQSASFMLFNLLAGEAVSGEPSHVLLPVTPEYIGYGDQGLGEGLFRAVRPEIEFLDGRLFKYRVDFARIHATRNTAAICVSRPTNPSGNVLTDDEVEGLAEIARLNDIPLILDCAYGRPFPGIIYTQASPRWDDGTVYCMSLSKLGLPGVRTGIVIAREDIVRALTGINAIINLTSAGLGPALTREIIASGEVVSLARDVIAPFYRRKVEAAVALLREQLRGCEFWIHRPEGAFFLWLWLRGLPITAQTLYERLRTRGVLILPGQHFFPGLEEPWEHRHECVRINYAGDDDSVGRGLRILAEEVHTAYAGE